MDQVYFVGINKHQLKLVMQCNTNEPCDANNCSCVCVFSLKGNNIFSLILGLPFEIKFSVPKKDDSDEGRGHKPESCHFM